jgi:transposase-like protein
MITSAMPEMTRRAATAAIPATAAERRVLTDAGPVEISVPRGRDSSFEPKIVAKRQRRLTGGR